MTLSARNIFVNATATQPGGGYTILSQFLKAYALQPIADTYVYVFNSVGIEEYASPFIISVKLPVLNYLQRVYWDWKGMRKWADKHGIKPDLILSFQNTGVRFAGVQQVIYMQQSIPFVEHKWNFFKKEERALWMYKNIYPFFIGANLFKNTFLIVQTQWMKKAFLKKFKKHDPQKVYVFSPEIEVDIKPNNNVVKDTANGIFTFFYPATSFVYKNHIEIIKAFAAIIKQDTNWNALCYLTVTFDELSEIARDIIVRNELYSNFVFLGALSIDEVYNYYASVDALIFPSYIETIGLPLVESASFGLPVLVADEPYAREVLSNYSNVVYAKTKDTLDWKSKINYVQNLKKVSPQKINISEHGWPDMIQLLASLIKN